VRSRASQSRKTAPVRPLAPVTIEAMRAGRGPRDAALISMLATGVRPGEAVALRWGDVRERTPLVGRGVSLGDQDGRTSNREAACPARRRRAGIADAIGQAR
jgi:integrase